MHSGPRLDGWKADVQFVFVEVIFCYKSLFRKKLKEAEIKNNDVLLPWIVPLRLITWLMELSSICLFIYYKYLAQSRTDEVKNRRTSNTHAAPASARGASSTRIQASRCWFLHSCAARRQFRSYFYEWMLKLLEKIILWTNWAVKKTATMKRREAETEQMREAEDDMSGSSKYEENKILKVQKQLPFLVCIFFSISNFCFFCL